MNETQQTPRAGGSPIDPVLTKLINEATGAGRGFALGLADRAKENGTGELTFRLDQTLPPVDEYERPVSWRSHRVEDVPSLVTIARKYSKADCGLILYTDRGATLCLDETKERGDRELVSLEFRKSPEFTAWLGLLSQPQQHKPLLDAMLTLQHTLVDPTILNAMRRVRLSWEANHESDVRIDGETFGVSYKSKAGTEIIDFPRAWRITVPILDQDLTDDAAWVTIDVRLEVEMPTRPEMPVMFRLFAPKLGIAVRDRIDREIGIARSELEGWTIARGQHSQIARHVGVKR